MALQPHKTTLSVSKLLEFHALPLSGGLQTIEVVHPRLHSDSFALGAYRRIEQASCARMNEMGQVSKELVEFLRWHVLQDSLRQTHRGCLAATRARLSGEITSSVGRFDSTSSAGR